MDEQNIIIDKIEEATDNKGKRYLKVTDKAGVTRNIKQGRNNLLDNKELLLKPGCAIKLHLKDFKDSDGNVHPYVFDFETIESIFEQQATEKVQSQVSKDRESSIEQQVAIKEIGENWRADKEIPEGILLLYWAWIQDRLDTHPPPEAIESVTEGSKPIVSSLVFTNPTALVNYAIKQGIKWDTIQEKLSISSPNEIKDLKGAPAILFGETGETKLTGDKKLFD